MVEALWFGGRPWSTVVGPCRQALGTTAAVRGIVVTSCMWSGASQPRPSATTIASSPGSRTKSDHGFTNARPPRLTDSKVALWSLRRSYESASIDWPMYSSGKVMR